MCEEEKTKKGKTQKKGVNKEEKRKNPKEGEFFIKMTDKRWKILQC